MNRDKLADLMGELHVEHIKLMNGKSADYADEDALSNFKRMNELCKSLRINTSRSPWDCAMFLALLKIDRWCNLTAQGLDPANESIWDTMLDLHNYLDIAYACQCDTVKKSETGTGGMANMGAKLP